MTSVAFTFLSRFLVLFGLFFANISNAGQICVSSGMPAFTSPEAICTAMNGRPQGNGTWQSLVPDNNGTCYGNLIENGTGAVLATNAVPPGGSYTCTCPITQTPIEMTIGRGSGSSLLISESNALLNTNGLPPPKCENSCVNTFTAAGTPFIASFESPLGGYGDRFFSLNRQPSTYTQTGTKCVMPPVCPLGQYAGIAGSCVSDPDYCPPPNLKDANGLCKPPLPKCTPPQVLNQQFICETPACPLGQVRKTALSACEPIVCTPPLVKEGNFCILPKCAAGETYEFSNGSGQCVKNAPVCTPPQTLVNGVCKTPTCGFGMVLSPSGSCIPDPAINPNTSGTGSGGVGTSGTGIGITGSGTGTGGGTGSATGTGGSGGGTGTGTGTTGTATGGTTGGATGSGGGSNSTSTNSGKAGLCETPPCGECDPAVATCGDTFGGSCKSGYQCNGDAIQCAVAVATNKAECDLKAIYVDVEVDPAFIEGKQVFDAGTKALGTEGGIQVTNGSNITINRLNPFSSSCPSDQPLFEYKGTRYTFPLSKYCNIFQTIGTLMLLIAGFISIKILMKVD